MSDRANRSRKSEADVDELKAYLDDMQDARATEVELVKARLGNRLGTLPRLPESIPAASILGFSISLT